MLIALLGHGLQIFLLIIISSAIADQARLKEDRSTCLLWSKQLYTSDQITMINSTSITPTPLASTPTTDGTTNSTSMGNGTLVVVTVPTLAGARAAPVSVRGAIYYIQGLAWSCDMAVYGSAAAIAISASLFLATSWHALSQKSAPHWWRITSTTLSFITSILILFQASLITGGAYTTCRTLGSTSLDPNAVRDECGKVYPGTLLTVLVGAGCAELLLLSYGPTTTPLYFKFLFLPYVLTLYKSLHTFIQYRHLRQLSPLADSEGATTPMAEFNDTNMKSMWGSSSPTSASQAHPPDPSPAYTKPSTGSVSTTSTNPFSSMVTNPFSNPYDMATVQVAGGNGGVADGGKPWATAVKEEKGRTAGGYSM
ncbi:hypothetical protein HDU93_000144 [Gonapodya sp. JEL0774]|nr:hypothetical protein HDU93_000144 [Gonapodya sp. JEL0774]